MTQQVSRPSGVNVGVNNPGTTVYITGNESTDDSLRYETVIFNSEIVTEIQKRIDGLWQPTSFKTGAESVLVGTLIKLSAAGSHLITTDDSGNTIFHAHSDFKDGVTTRLSNIINALSFEERVIFRPDESGSFTGTSISTIDVNSATHLITEAFYFKTDAVAASEAVRIQAWQGTDDTGLLIFDQTYPASDFPANTEIRLELEGFLEFNIGDTTFTRITSDANFSLRTDVPASTWWLAIDFSAVKNDDLLQTDEWISGDSFTQGVLTTQDRFVYEANETGIQTGIFTDNLDKWDKLISIQGFDRILNSVDGNSIADNSGDLIIRNAA